MPDIEIKYNNTTIASLDGYYVGSAPQEAIKTCTGGVDWKYNY